MPSPDEGEAQGDERNNIEGAPAPRMDMVPARYRPPSNRAAAPQPDGCNDIEDTVHARIDPPRYRVPPAREVDDNISEDEITLKYGAEHVMKLFIPVSICMSVVVATVSSVTFYTEKGLYLIYTPYHETSDSVASNVGGAFINAFILLGVVVVMTFLLILLYKFRLYRIIHVWLMFSSLILLFLFTFMYLVELLQIYNIGLDWISASLIVFNFGAVGMMVIHWKGPLLLQQAYLIFVASLMSLMFIKHLPEYTTWVVLGVISIWDLIAVLCPKGPLRILVETAQERNEPIFPALIYSSNIAYMSVTNEDSNDTISTNDETTEANLDNAAAANPNTPEESNGEVKNLNESKVDVKVPVEKTAAKPKSAGVGRPCISTGNVRVSPASGDHGFERLSDEEAVARARRRRDRAIAAERNRQADQNVGQSVPVEEDDDEDRGVKLGLGDFIFYSVLVGKASSYGDWNTTIACFIAILIGLCLTLMMLAIWRKALPALPISITFGLIFYFSTSYFVVPFEENLSISQVFI